MRKTPIFLLLFISIIVSGTNAQTHSDTVQIIAKKLELFEFREVITLVDTAIITGKNFTIAEKVELFKMKAIAHYSLWELQKADSAFRELLKLDPMYQLDPIKTSPKIISFYNDVKTQFMSEYSRTTPVAPDTAKKDTLQNIPIVKKIIVDRSENIYKSLVLPGWGQLAERKNTKGYIFVSAGLLTLTSFLYYSIDTNEKETMYLNEVNRNLIESRYRDYNNSYKLKNISLIGFVAVWITAQIDMFLFPPETISEENMLLSVGGSNSRFTMNNSFMSYSILVRF